MSSFITQHNATDVASFEGACNWHADCRNVHQSCCPWIECSLLYHKPSPKAFQRIWQYIQPASQPQTTCNLNIQHLHLQDRLTPATRTAAATIGLHNQRNSAPIVRNHLREAHLHACRLQRLKFVVVTDLSGQMLTFDGVWHFGEVFSSWMNPGFHCTGQMADSVYGVMWVSGLLMSTLWIEWPMVVVGLWYGQAYVMDNEHRCILLMAFWMHRDTVTHCCAIHPRPSPHVAAW